MKKLANFIIGISLTNISSSFVFPAKAQAQAQDYLVLTGEFTNCGTGLNIEQCQTQKIYEVNQSTGKSTLIKEFNNPYGWGNTFYDEYSNKIVIEPDNNWDYGDGRENAFSPKFAVYDRNTGEISEVVWFFWTGPIVNL